MIKEKIIKQFIIVKSLILNDKEEVLFVRRKREFHKEAHNKWEFPGGKVDFGEFPEETARREAKEETGYDVEVDYLLPKLLSSKWVSPEKEAQQILICYVCKLIGEEKHLGDHAVSDIRWFKINDVPADSECLLGTINFLKIYLSAIKK